MTEDERRRRTTIAGAIFLLALLGVSYWVMQAVADRQALERCLNAGRRDCAGSISAPAERGYAPTR